MTKFFAKSAVNFCETKFFAKSAENTQIFGGLSVIGNGFSVTVFCCHGNGHGNGRSVTVLNYWLNVEMSTNVDFNRTYCPQVKSDPGFFMNRLLAKALLQNL